MDHYKQVDRRLCLGIDMQGYGSRPGGRHAEFQHDLVTLLDQAAARAGLDRDRWSVQRSGDGEFAVLPAGQAEGSVIDDFVRELAGGLSRRNEHRTAPGRIRLRLAVHFGPVESAPNGFAGDGPVVVGRLLDSRPLRRALAADMGADLAVILSRQVYADTVAAEMTDLRPADFAEVHIEAKEFTDSAWIRVPGVTAERLGWLLAGSDDNDDTGPAPAPDDDAARVAQSAGASTGGSVRQAGRDLAGDRYGPTYVNHTVVEGDVNSGPDNVFGFRFGGDHG